MNGIDTRKVQCPYCGEIIEVLIDCSVTEQFYIEDCQVCCRPIEFNVAVDNEGVASVAVSHENE